MQIFDEPKLKKKKTCILKSGRPLNRINFRRRYSSRSVNNVHYNFQSNLKEVNNKCLSTQDLKMERTIDIHIIRKPILYPNEKHIKKTFISTLRTVLTEHFSILSSFRKEEIQQFDRELSLIKMLKLEDSKKPNAEIMMGDKKGLTLLREKDLSIYQSKEKIEYNVKSMKHIYEEKNMIKKLNNVYEKLRKINFISSNQYISLMNQTYLNKKI